MTDSRRIVGDCRDVLRQLIDEGVKVQMCVTSPPYWGLRDYGTGVWEGGDAGCPHLEITKGGQKHGSGGTHKCGASFHGGAEHAELATKQYRRTCAKCGARRVDKQIGLEARHDCLGWATGNRCGECHVCVIVEVFRLVREVLADDGVLFLNYGDGYASSGSSSSAPRERPDLPNPPAGWSTRDVTTHKRTAVNGLKPKDLIGMPWRIALALQNDGWYLRQDIIWSKRNPMPESVTDRCTKSHEYLFLLAKSPRYFFDCEAIREGVGNNTHSKGSQYHNMPKTAGVWKRNQGKQII